MAASEGTAAEAWAFEAALACASQAAVVVVVLGADAVQDDAARLAVYDRA